MNLMKLGGNLRLVFGALTLVMAGTVSALANHPVLVEGNCFGVGAAQRTLVPVGTCGDYDGDGRIGTAEDTDEQDRVFGTINAALGGAIAGNPAISGIANNGTITIVTSGTFPEIVTITGNVTLQAAPGVVADLDAVVQGDPGSGARQGQPGIIVNAPATRYVVIRNITSKNWTSGIQINGSSRVAIESCKFENNVNYGIEVTGNAKVTIAKSEVHATGFRQSAVGDFPAVNQPNPGKGIEFDDNSSGTVFSTTVSGSFRAGISDSTSGGGGRNRNVCVYLVNVFDNNPNFEGIYLSNSPCGGNNRGGSDY